MVLNNLLFLLLSALLLGGRSVHAASRRGMSIDVYNRTPFPLRIVEATKGKTNGDWRPHFVMPNGHVVLANKDVRPHARM